MMRNVLAFLLHRVASGLNWGAMRVQRLGFMAELGAQWREASQHHYETRIRQMHYRLNQK
jgi:hypothetical protein